MSIVFLQNVNAELNEKERKIFHCMGATVVTNIRSYCQTHEKFSYQGYVDYLKCLLIATMPRSELVNTKVQNIAKSVKLYKKKLKTMDGPFHTMTLKVTRYKTVVNRDAKFILSYLTTERKVHTRPSKCMITRKFSEHNTTQINST